MTSQLYEFVVGQGYKFYPNCPVQMDIVGRPISEYDEGFIIKQTDQWNYLVENHKTGQIVEYHYKNLLPNKREMGLRYETA